ncbi:MAG: formate dehydrogenase accessory protein FdhE [Anaerolineae bacterium]|nr:formate dehydrogenase accessory protein FdhE [Anaerolineae bacterium]
MANKAAAPAIDPNLAPFVRRIDLLAKRGPQAAEIAEFYRGCIPILRVATQAIEPLDIDLAYAEAKLAAGMPVLVDEDLPLDIDAYAALFVQLCEVIENLKSPAAFTAAPAAGSVGKSLLSGLFKRGKPDVAKVMTHIENSDANALRRMAAGQLRQVVKQGKLDLGEAYGAILSGDRDALTAMAHAHQLDMGLLTMLAQNSLRPAFRAWANGLSALDTSFWQRGLCPICGAIAIFSEIAGKESERHLICGMCGCRWRYPRLQCMSCGCDDHHQLGRISGEGDDAEKYFAQTCNRCQSYNKFITNFDPIATELLQVEDLLCGHFDVEARRQGFHGNYE